MEPASTTREAARVFYANRYYITAITREGIVVARPFEFYGRPYSSRLSYLWCTVRETQFKEVCASPIEPAINNSHRLNSL